MDMNDFYKGKKILVTGYTGFKGAYLSHILYRMGADAIHNAQGIPDDTHSKNFLLPDFQLSDALPFSLNES